MTRTRLSLISTTALASLLGAALPAFAQAPAPAPMYAPPPQAPMMAPAPAQEPMPVMPVAPVMAPRAADDMTGSVGFGVGVLGGPSLVTTNNTIAMKYWMSDAMALIPQLALNMNKVKSTDMAWNFAPQLLADFTLLKGASTRLSAGLGLGLRFAKNMAPATTTDTYIAFRIPVQIGVEHFFARWFSMGLGATFNFLQYIKDGTAPWSLDVEVSNINYMGSLFFYTD